MSHTISNSSSSLTIDEVDRYLVIIEYLKRIEPYYIMFLVTVGLIGNSISFAIFISSKIKKKDSNCILASLSLVDNLFLLKLTIVNLRHFGIDPFNRYTYVCKLIVFSSFICGFLSVWLVTLFSIERFIAVISPLRRFLICNRRRNKLSIFALVIFSVVFYSLAFASSGIEIEGNYSRCVTYESWYKTVEALATVDILLSILVPFIIILVINISISFKLTQMRLMSRKADSIRSQSNSPANVGSSGLGALIDNDHHSAPVIDRTRLSTCFSKNRIQMPRSSSQYTTTDEAVDFIHMDAAPRFESDRAANLRALLNYHTPSLATNCRFSTHQAFVMSTHRRNGRQRINSYSRTTRILILISISYFVLNAPMVYSKLKHFFASDDEGQSVHVNPYREEIIERLSCYLYYMNFSINFFLYVLNRSTFREILLNLFKKKKSIRC